MKINIERKNDAYHLEASNESGNRIQMDASPNIGGVNAGMSPMQLLLVALGGCSTIDVVSILKKQQTDLKDIKISIEGQREKDKTPSLFTDIHIHFTLWGKDLELGKVQRAIDLSLEKYCSVAKTLEPTAKITSSFEILAA